MSRRRSSIIARTKPREPETKPKPKPKLIGGLTEQDLLPLRIEYRGGNEFAIRAAQLAFSRRYPKAGTTYEEIVDYLGAHPELLPEFRGLRKTFGYDPAKQV